MSAHEPHRPLQRAPVPPAVRLAILNLGTRKSATTLLGISESTYDDAIALCNTLTVKSLDKIQQALARLAITQIQEAS